MRATIIYSTLRILFFAVPFLLLVATSFEWYIALGIALIISLTSSYIFLSKLRTASAAELAGLRNRRTAHQDDEDAEDAFLDNEDR